MPKRNQIDEAVINLQREIEILQAAIEVLFAIKKSKKATALVVERDRALARRYGKPKKSRVQGAYVAAAEDKSA